MRKHGLKSDRGSYRKRITNQRGFTLLELLIAMVMTGVLVSAGYGVYINQHKGWLIQEQITTMQQNARVGMHEMETRIRMAGYNLPGNSFCISRYFRQCIWYNQPELLGLWRRGHFDKRACSI